MFTQKTKRFNDKNICFYCTASKNKKKDPLIEMGLGEIIFKFNK